MSDLTNRNSGIKNPISSFFWYSCDPGRDLMYINQSQLGQAGVTLLPKFNINGITNCPEWQQCVAVANGTYVPYFQCIFHGLNYNAPVTQVSDFQNYSAERGKRRCATVGWAISKPTIRDLLH